MPSEITAAALAKLLDTGATLALIDVREHGEYNPAHIAGTSSVPRRQLERAWAGWCRSAGSGGGVRRQRPPRGAGRRTLERMGYRRVAVLDGGVNRWASDNLPTEWGMNVPSKDFGEKVEVEHHVPPSTPTSWTGAAAR